MLSEPPLFVVKKKLKYDKGKRSKKQVCEKDEGKNF